MYRPVKKNNRGRFESLTPEIDREVVERMDRQSARMSLIASRRKLIAQLQAEIARDEADNARDKEACQELESRKARVQDAVKRGKLIHVDFSPRQHNKPPKRAA